jgi:hypothetical protein
VWVGRVTVERDLATPADEGSWLEYVGCLEPSTADDMV